MQRSRIKKKNVFCLTSGDAVTCGHNVSLITLSVPVLRGDGTYEPDYSQYDTEMSTFSMSQSQVAHAVTGKHTTLH